MNLCLKGKGNIDEIYKNILEVMYNSGITSEPKGLIKQVLGEETVYLIVFEKYYLRASNRVSATILINSNKDLIEVNAIGSGGGQGAIFNLSFGAESSILKPLRKYLLSIGFIEQEV